MLIWKKEDTNSSDTHLCGILSASTTWKAKWQTSFMHPLSLTLFSSQLSVILSCHPVLQTPPPTEIQEVVPTRDWFSMAELLAKWFLQYRRVLKPCPWMLLKTGGEIAICPQGCSIQVVFIFCLCKRLVNSLLLGLDVQPCLKKYVYLVTLGVCAVPPRSQTQLAYSFLLHLTFSFRIVG